MRVSVTAAAAVTGALTLSALAVPASQAAQTARPAERPVIKKVVVNGGKPIVVGTKSRQKVAVSITASSPSGIADAYVFLWHGHIDEVDAVLGQDQPHGTCTVAPADPTTSTCTATITVDPRSGLGRNTLAGTWQAAGGAVAATGDRNDESVNETAASVRLQRFSKLTVNAAPEPVKKGKTITVTGKLTRANWDTATYKGYAAQPVKLQFKKKGAKSYTTVKTVKTSSTGTLKTTVKASVDGHWRYSFAGTSTTPAVSATGDYVDVR
ncbi:calcium-binding protein [Streptomyces sp. SID8374]|uniref:calcium-binding protein n=1 Tax=Streptomyces sp. SID8374 TaxID=2690354 RepID=UPI00136F7083|nr:calcium-binding protein [Streptomyces sp. SID8374]MYX15598.1 calcium-binding protein [Streptomyces sp. SID8374]